MTKATLIASIIAIVLGSGLIGLSMYIKRQTGAARESVQKGKSLFSKNKIESSVGKIIEGAAEGKIAQYELKAKWSLYSGIILIVLSVSGVILYYRK